MQRDPDKRLWTIYREGHEAPKGEEGSSAEFSGENDGNDGKDFV